MDNTIIAKRISELLATRNVKQKELAKVLNVTDNTVSYYVNGARTPNINQIIEISKYFNVSTDYLLGLSDAASTDMDLKTVCDYTGLNEFTIQKLNEKKDNIFFRQTIDFLLKEYKILSLFSYYVIITSINDEINKTSYSLVPTKKHIQDKKIIFADIIQSLPHARDEFTKYLQETPDLCENLILECLSVIADNDMCKYYTADFYDLYEEPGSYCVDDIDDAERQQFWDDYEKEMDKIIEAEVEKRNKVEIERTSKIEKVMAYIKQKEGATNGNNPKEG